MDELFLSLSLVVEELKNPFPPLWPLIFLLNLITQIPNTYNTVSTLSPASVAVAALQDQDHTAMEKNEKQRNRSLSKLPLDLIGSILSRLPVKCLLQLKCVCRAWHDLISNPKFAKYRLKHFIIQEKLMLMEHFLYPVQYDGLNSVVEELDYPVTPSSVYVFFNIVGSCNGLLLINPKNDALVLWNPSTREARELPKSPIEFPTRSRKCLSTLYGFGNDSFAADYKLVRVVTFATERFETEVKLYSLGTNSWKRIEDFPYSVPNKSDGILVNGALHWLVYLENDLVCPYFVSYLDLAEEKYGWLELPDYESGQSFCDIGVLGGCLHMYRYVSDIIFEVWSMREYGTTESWTKFSIIVPHMTGLENFVHVKPLCLTEKGQIILRVGRKKLVMYNPKEELFRYLRFHGLSENSVVGTYVESLVSPYNFDVPGGQYHAEW